MMKFLFTIIMALQVVTGITGCASRKVSSVSISWRIAATLPLVNGKQPGVAGACAGVHNNIMLVAGGANFPDSMPWLGGRKKYQDNVYAFTRGQNGQLKALDTIFKLHQPLAYAASVSTEQGIVCAGGENDSGISNEVFMMKWDRPGNGIRILMLPSLPYALTNASITTHNQKIYIAGGEMGDSVSSHFLSLDLNDTASGWKSLTPLPYPVSHAVLAFFSDHSGDDIYLAGGRKKNPQSTSTFYKDLYAYNMHENKWRLKSALPYALSAATGIATKNSILIFGGDRGETFHLTELLIAQMEKAKDAVKKQSLNQQKAVLQSTHPGFRNEVLEYHPSTNEWKVIDTIAFEVPVTTTVFRWEDDIIIPSGEVKAGLRTPAILAGKLIEEK
jgi:N-acetylneuraminate epimerase